MIRRFLLWLWARSVVRLHARPGGVQVELRLAGHDRLRRALCSGQWVKVTKRIRIDGKWYTWSGALYARGLDTLYIDGMQEKEATNARG